MKTKEIFNRVFNRKNAIDALIWLVVLIIFSIPFGLETAFALVLPLIIPVHLNYILLDKFIKREKYIKYGVSKKGADLFIFLKILCCQEKQWF